MVQYRTGYRQNPGGQEAGMLTNYVCRGDVGRVERASGVTASSGDVDAFEALASGSDLARLHSFAFAEDRAPDVLASEVRGVIADHLDGSYLVGVDVESEGNNHLHVAQAGDWDEVYMDHEDIAAIRSDVADAVGESVAANQVVA